MFMNKTYERSVADLKIGEKAIIKNIKSAELQLKLMEMGCLPGEEIQVIKIAPLKDPIAVVVADYNLSLRISEAAEIIVD